MKELAKTDRDRFSILFTIEKTITEEQAMEIQIQLGYHPAGYGPPYQFKSENNISTWKCSNTSD